MTLSELNSAPERSAYDALALCCVSEAWISGMLGARPFPDHASLKRSADLVWAQLGEADFLEAFEGHPRIGDVDSLKQKYAASGTLAAREQSGVAQASDSVIERLAAGNARYEKTFGFMFIVCASGKTAQQMSELLERRLGNTREQELNNAAEEQRKILQLRLDAMQ